MTNAECTHRYVQRVRETVCPPNGIYLQVFTALQSNEYHPGGWLFFQTCRILSAVHYISKDSFWTTRNQLHPLRIHIIYLCLHEAYYINVVWQFWFLKRPLLKGVRNQNYARILVSLYQINAQVYRKKSKPSFSNLTSGIQDTTQNVRR